MLERVNYLQEGNKYCCENHVDLAFDDFILENETYPFLQVCNHAKCDYCAESSAYVLEFLQE
jgi:hypothetical protein